MTTCGFILRAAAVVLAAQVCVACSQTGDFGRTNVDATSNYAVTRASAEDRSQHFSLTDEEREMSSRIQRFMTMSHAVPWLNHAMLTRVGLLRQETNQSTYYDWIKSERFASSRGPYNRLQNDIRLDLASLPQTFSAICKVQEIDRRRDLALGNLINIELQTEVSADERLAENRARIDQFSTALSFRYTAYVYALEHLLVETPHEQARDIDADLSNLATARQAAFSDSYCAQPRQYAAPALGAI